MKCAISRKTEIIEKGEIDNFNILVTLTLLND